MTSTKGHPDKNHLGQPPFDGYVVCIGASAGGLDALERFFKACPDDTGAAFVVIQHLSPDRARPVPLSLPCNAQSSARFRDGRLQECPAAARPVS